MSRSDTPMPLSPPVVANVQRERSTFRPRVSFRRTGLFFTALALAIIVAADFLFFRQSVGCTAAIFLALLVASLWITGGEAWRNVTQRRAKIILTLGLIGLVIAMLIEPWWLPMVLAFFGLFSLAIVDRSAWTSSVPAWLARWGEFIGRGVCQFIYDWVLAQRWRATHGGKRNPLSWLLANWAIPVLLSLVFVVLFSIANPVISRWISHGWSSLTRFASNIGEYVPIGRIALWLAVGISVWGLLRTRTRSASRVGDVRPSEAGGTARLASPALLVRCLLMFNIVFAVQTAMDLYYLWGGASLPEGMSYSEYARRGAYPLVATALLAAGFVLATFRAGGSAATIDHRIRWARRLVYFWIAQNLLLMISAGWRLWLYVDIYSLTRLRIAAAIWMLLVAIGLVSIIWRVVGNRSNAWLLRFNTLSATFVLYVCCFINFDSLIAWHNVTHCREVVWCEGRRDFDESLLAVGDLKKLGPDALPATVWVIDTLGSDHVLNPHLTKCRDSLRADLSNQTKNWRGWTWRRAHLDTASAPN